MSRTISLLLLAQCAALAAAAAPLSLPGGAEAANITPGIALFTDLENRVALEDILASPGTFPFARSGEELIYAGLNNASVWVRLTLPPGDGREFVLEYDNPRHTRVDLYIPRGDGTFEVRKSGQAVPYFQREIPKRTPAFSLTLPRDRPTVCYLHTQNSGVMRFSLFLWERGAFLNHLAAENIPYALMCGVILAMAVFHFIISLGLRERGYFYLAVFEIVFMLYYLSIVGYLSVVPGLRSDWFAARASSTIASLTLCFGLLFMHALLDAHKTIPRLGKAMLALAAVSALAGMFRVSSESLVGIRIIYVLGIIAPVVAVSATVAALRIGHRTARLALLTWGMAMGGTILIALEGLGLWPGAGTLDRYYILLFFGAVFLWSFALTGRVRVRESEARVTLEREVERRIAELRKALHDVKTLSGLLPICSHCKSIRDDKGYWKQLESYLAVHTDADFSHSICPDCMTKLYPQYAPGSRISDSPAPFHRKSPE